MLKSKYIYINGKKYKNLPLYKKYLSYEYLYDVFKYDIYSDIHGDFTIENIICIKDKDDYYIIDPNTDNFHSSPFLDYAKLLQSIHGNYEFLSNINYVKFKDNRIDFVLTNFNVYDKLYTLYKEYLNSKYNFNQLKSIYFHEIVHWLRLLPYKIEKNKELSIVFYASMIKIINDIDSMFLVGEEI